MPMADHPFRAWRREQGLSLADAAAQVEKSTDRSLNPQYLRHIEAGRNVPSWTLARALASLCGADPVSVIEWRSPDRKPRPSKRRAA